MTRVIPISVPAGAQPDTLDLMREGAADSRGLNLFPALKNEDDTVASISGITVVRTDGKVITPDDLTISPVGHPSPSISADSSGNPAVVVTWWQAAGVAIAADGPVQYLVTVSVITTAGRALEYDAYQAVTPSLG